MTVLPVKFGKEFRKRYFTRLGEEVCNVNHGSFGLTPDVLIDSYLAQLEKESAFPEKYIRVGEKPDYIEALKLLSQPDLLDCDYHDLALVENATVAVNTILRSLPFKEGDKLVVTDTTYGACLNTAKFLKLRYGVELIIINHNFPLTKQEILDKYEKVFSEEKPKLCLLDAVVSSPSYRMPFEDIVGLCKKYSVLSLVDAAHGIGLIDLKLGTLRPDFLVSNLHKWYFVQRSRAFLFIHPTHQRAIHSLPVSHSFLEDHATMTFPRNVEDYLIDTFFFIGTEEKANIPTIKEAYRFRNEVCGGEMTIRQYCRELCYKVGEVITQEIWPDTFYLDNEEKTAITAMINIAVPFGGFLLSKLESNEVFDCLREIEDKVLLGYNTFTPLLVNNNTVYVRFSCQIYNEVDDFVFAARVLQKTAEKVIISKLRRQ